MTATLETIVGSESEQCVASQTHRFGRSAVFFEYLLRRFLAPAFALCSIVLVTAPVNAGGLPAVPTPGAARIDDGWWSPETATPITPQLQISMAEVTHFAASDFLRNSSAQPASHLSGSAPDSSTSVENVGTTPDAKVAQPTLVVDRLSLAPKAELTLLQDEYQRWESNLSASRPLTYVDGAPVHPLLQINYAEWHLPVTLYVSPLRGSDSR